MAMIIVENTGKKGEVEKGREIKDTCEELGIPFGCKQGRCGTCRIKVIRGIENLFEKNEKENDMALEEGERLTCQCRIKEGTVIIKSTLY